MAVCYELLIKSFMIMTVLSLCLLLFKKRTAAFRHFLLSMSFFCLLLMVVLSLWGPGWEAGMYNLVQDKLSYARKDAGTVHLTLKPSSRLMTEGQPADGDVLVAFTEPVEKSAGASGFYGKTIVSFFSNAFLWIWGTGILFLAVRFFLGLVHVVRLTRSGSPVSSERVKYRVLEISKTFNISRNICLIKHRDVRVPMTWGMINPIILLPEDSCRWGKKQYETVLLHELSHIRRWDFLVMMLSRWSFILFWCNPLMWFALKHLKREQEKACDEMVLNAGIKPSAYASFLLSMKRSMDCRIFASSAALGMAGFSEIHDRLAAILKKNKPKKEVGMKFKIIISIIVIVVVALVATAKPVHSKVPESDGILFGSDNSTGFEQEKSTGKTEEKKAVKTDTGKKTCKTITIETVEKDKTLGVKKKNVKTIELDGSRHQTRKIVLDGDYVVTVTEGEEPHRTVKKIKGKPGDETLTIMIKDNKIYMMREDREHKLLHSEKIGSDKEKKHIWISRDGKHDELIKVIEPFRVMALKESELKKRVAELEKSIKKLKENDIKTQEDVLKSMEKSLAEMKEELEHTAVKMEKIHRMPRKLIKKIDGDMIDIHISDEDLIRIDEEGHSFIVRNDGDEDLIIIKEDDDVFHIKKHDDEVTLSLKEKLPKGKGYFSVETFRSRVRLDRVNVNKLKIHVADLKKKLPKGYEVELKIGEEQMHVKITSDGKKFEEKTQKKVKKILDAFSKKLDDILPNLTRKRNIYIKK